MIEGPRAAKSEELPKIIHSANEIFLTKRGIPPVFDKIFPQLFNEDNLENLRVIVKNGDPISHVGTWEGDLFTCGSWFKAGMVGAVYTHPDHRGRGHASNLIGDAFSKMKGDGVDLVLVSGFRNLYKRAGCVEAGRVHVYRIPSGKLHLRDESLGIEAYRESNVNDLVDIYQKEPLRYQRSLEDFRLLSERGFRCSDVPLKIYVATTEDGTAAYIATGLFPNQEVLRIEEYAGHRRLVLHLIENVFRMTKVNSVLLTVPFQDAELLRLLEEQGLEKPPSESPACMSILNPQSFLEKAKPYLKERTGKDRRYNLTVDEGTGKMKLTINGEEINLEDSRGLTLLFFGAPERMRNPPQLEINLKPFHSLFKVIPMPTPVYGLNFI